MADYNIYVHTIGGGGSVKSNPTTPWSQRADSGNNGDDGGLSVGGANLASFGKVVGTLTNPDSIVSNALSFTKKALPIVAAAFIVTSAMEKVASLQCNYAAEIHGDYRYAHAWNNYQATKNLLFSPISTMYGAHLESTRRNVEDERRRTQASLLGDSVINSYYGRGV